MTYVHIPPTITPPCEALMLQWQVAALREAISSRTGGKTYHD